MHYLQKVIGIFIVGIIVGVELLMTNDELNTDELSFCGVGAGAVVIELVFIVVIESIEYVNVLVIVNVVVSDELIALVLIILVLDIELLNVMIQHYH